jgi:hypothetical protein
MLTAAIDAYYGNGADAYGTMGNLIASVVLSARKTFTVTAEFERLLQFHPIFGADLALCLHHKDNKRFGWLPTHICQNCQRGNTVNIAGFSVIGPQILVLCVLFCGKQSAFSSQC